ncbi:MAG: nitrite reductase, copper-containing [Sphingobacteriales bacterium]|nr:nitrite reductase, copper-containing [Sphingobacteriales bacterium]
MKTKNQLLKILHYTLLLLCIPLFMTSCKQTGSNSNETIWSTEPADKIVGEEKAILTDPPMVPPAITRNHATKVIVDLEVIEKEMEIMEGVKYMFWTFGGTVPGKFIRVREGDLVEFHLKNHPDNKLPHNIDLHSVTGQGGGASSTFTPPGHETVFSFTAINKGLFIYHCATAPVGMHIANGMYGLILVEPKEGLPKVDKEFYICQGDFYTKGAYGESGTQPFDMSKALTETPDYVLFNGKVGALTGDNAIKATAGDKVRLFIGNGGPNLISSFHVIGEIFDNVYVEGGELINHNLQTTLVPAGGSAITEFRCEIPGNFILVDHSIFRTFNKGTLGILKVEGKENKAIYSGQLDDRIYQSEGGAIQNMPEAAKGPVKQLTKDERIAAGKAIYASVCQACHQADAKGIPNSFPPLAASDYFKGNPNKAINAVVHGLSGAITVNGKPYNSIMPKQTLSDEEVANVITYVINNFGNGGGEVTPAQVIAARKSGSATAE